MKTSQVKYTHPIFFGFPAHMVQALDLHITQHLQCWQHLANESLRDGMMLFRLRPKAHYFHHIGRDAARNRLNPRLVANCIHDESFLGYIKKIAVRCHSSTMVERKVLAAILFVVVTSVRKISDPVQLATGVPSGLKEWQ